MAVSKTKRGWRYDRNNSRLDFYFDGTRIGAIDAGGIDLASGLTFDVAGVTATASTLDAAYDGGKTITVDGAAVKLDGSHASNNTLEVVGAGTGALIDLDQNSTGGDIDGSDSAWSVAKDGEAAFTNITLTAGTVPANTNAYIASDNAGDLNLNAKTGKSMELRVAGTNVITMTGSAITLAQATSVSAGGLTVDAGGFTVTAGATTAITSTNITLTGATAIVGATTITGALSVSGNMTWGSTLTVDELILDTDGTPPGGTNAYIVRDNTNDLTINTASTGEIHLAINGNDEYDFHATEFELASGNYIQFLGDNGILDSGGDEVILVERGSTPVNYLVVHNAATGSPVKLECKGTADKGFIFINQEDELILTLTSTPTTLYNLNLITAASGSPVIQTEGGHDIGIDFENDEGEEMLQLVSGPTAVNHIVITSVASATTRPQIACSAEDVGITFTDGSATPEEILELIPVSTAINHVCIVSAASGAPTIACSAADTGLIFAEGTATREEMLILSATAGAVAQVTIASAATGTHPTITGSGETDTGLNIVASGTGPITFNNGTDPVILRVLGAQAGYNNEIQDVNGNEIIALQGVASAVAELKVSNAVDAGNVTVGVQTSGTNAGLLLDTAGTGNIVLSLGGVEVLGIHDAAVTIAAAAATAGHALYMQTEDGGTVTAAVGAAGAAWEMRTGDGSVGDGGTNNGGAGGAFTIVCGAGNTGVSTGNGGVGGQLNLIAGAGGACGAGAGDGGDGGDIVLTPGAGGGAGSGDAGLPGQVKVSTGCLAFSAQAVDMANGALTLTLDPADTAGTLITSNVLLVDPNGGAQNLLMPKEAACTGIVFYIASTADAAENINLQDDGGGGIGTIGQDEVGMAVSDGTNWHIFVGVA